MRVAAVREKNVMEDPSDEMRCCDTCEFYVPHDPRRRDWGFCVQGPGEGERVEGAADGGDDPAVQRHRQDGIIVTRSGKAMPG